MYKNSIVAADDLVPNTGGQQTHSLIVAFNSLSPNDAIYRYRAGLTFAQVKICKSDGTETSLEPMLIDFSPVRSVDSHSRVYLYSSVINYENHLENCLYEIT